MILYGNSSLAAYVEINVLEHFLEIQRMAITRASERGNGALIVLTSLGISSGLGGIVDRVRVPHAVMKAREKKDLTPQQCLANSFSLECPTAAKFYPTEEDQIKFLDALSQAAHNKSIKSLLSNYEACSNEELRQKTSIALVEIKDTFIQSHDLRAFYAQLGLERDISEFIKNVDQRFHTPTAAKPQLPVLPVIPHPIPSKK